MKRVNSIVNDATLPEMGNDAGHSAALADLMAVALQANPDTSIAGEAVEDCVGWPVACPTNYLRWRIRTKGET